MLAVCVGRTRRAAVRRAHPRALEPAADPASRESFMRTHKHLVEGVADLARRIQVQAGGRAGASVCVQLASLAPGMPANQGRLFHRAQADRQLCALIRRKFAIKCTTGYSLNALVDFPADDPLEIVKRLMVGSEGTLAFVSKARASRGRRPPPRPRPPVS